MENLGGDGESRRRWRIRDGESRRRWRTGDGESRQRWKQRENDREGDGESRLISLRVLSRKGENEREEREPRLERGKTENIS